MFSVERGADNACASFVVGRNPRDVNVFERMLWIDAEPLTDHLGITGDFKGSQFQSGLGADGGVVI
jgi:hypothetical protein